MKINHIYLKNNILPIAVVCVFLVTYVLIFSNIKGHNAELIANLNWKDALILVLSYNIVKLFLSPVFKIVIWYRNLFLTLIMYAIIYGTLAFPFFLTSFLQPLSNNSFFHFFILIILIEQFIHFFSGGKWFFNSK